MAKVSQYRPAFFEGFESQQNEVQTFEEILNLDYVKAFADNPRFYRFSFSPNSYNARSNQRVIGHVMVELDEGKEWWVVASVVDFDKSFYTDDLLWTPKYKKEPPT